MVLGVDNRIELWNPTKWREHEAQGQSDISSGEGLADVGFI
jgi:DNA-binding transcriptional regulator/RsmH inhibitor MraZ